MLLAADKDGAGSELLAQINAAVQAGNSARLRATLGVIVTFALGILAGYVLYLLWEQVGLHDRQLANQQITIQRLSANEANVSSQISRLGALDGSIALLKAQLDLQTQRLAELEKGQNGVRDQVAGMNARWQREIRELSKVKPSIAIASPVVPSPTEQVPAAAANGAGIPAPRQQSADKHNETFSPDLKPTPNAYAQMSPGGLVVWMTPRPGFEKPVPTSVIGHVRGLGMLVHNWDDNSHYFITESGSWILYQR